MFKLPREDSERELKLNAADVKLQQRDHSSASEGEESSRDTSRNSSANNLGMGTSKNPFAISF
jgi:hypothetical protein